MLLVCFHLSGLQNKGSVFPGFPLLPKKPQRITRARSHTYLHLLRNWDIREKQQTLPDLQWSPETRPRCRLSDLTPACLRDNNLWHPSPWQEAWDIFCLEIQRQDGNTWSDKTAARENLAPRCLLLTSTFSTTCFPKEHTLVEQVMTMFSGLSYWLETP